MIDETLLKRVVRAMNSWLNLYDTEFPEELIDKGMEGIVEVADFLGLTEIAECDKDGVIQRYVMPEDFDKWLETRGETNA